MAKRSRESKDLSARRFGTLLFWVSCIQLSLAQDDDGELEVRGEELRNWSFMLESIGKALRAYDGMESSSLPASVRSTYQMSPQ